MNHPSVGDQKALTAALRELAASTALLEAPARVEANLRRAFHAPDNRRPRRWALVAAAVLILALASAAFWLRRPAHPAPEIATDFLPLLSADDWSPLDGGQIVRVRLPRSALTSFGLPMNEDKAWSLIHADVVVGLDGQARAIRFVQPPIPNPRRE